MKRAYTLIELIFVIVVIGILAGVASTSFKSDYLSVDRNFVLAKIKQAQYLGIGYEHRNFDGTFDSDMKGCIELTKTALEDKASEGNVAYKLHVDVNTNGLNNDILCFDAKGRPIDGDFATGTLLATKQEITLTYNGTKRIFILPKSGFAIIECN